MNTLPKLRNFFGTKNRFHKNSIKTLSNNQLSPKSPRENEKFTKNRPVTRKKLSRNRVIATPAPGMATQNPPQGEPCPSKRTMSAQSLDCILGARRSKTTARRKKRRDKSAIKTNRKNQQLAERIYHKDDRSLTMARSTRA